MLVACLKKEKKRSQNRLSTPESLSVVNETESENYNFLHKWHNKSRNQTRSRMNEWMSKRQNDHSLHLQQILFPIRLDSIWLCKFSRSSTIILSDTNWSILSATLDDVISQPFKHHKPLAPGANRNYYKKKVENHWGAKRLRLDCPDNQELKNLQLFN